MRVIVTPVNWDSSRSTESPEEIVPSKPPSDDETTADEVAAVDQTDADDVIEVDDATSRRCRRGRRSGGHR